MRFYINLRFKHTRSQVYREILIKVMSVSAAKCRANASGGKPQNLSHPCTKKPASVRDFSLKYHK